MPTTPFVLAGFRMDPDVSPPVAAINIEAASTNGVVGIKPTFGLVSRYGVVPISWTLDHLGPMARTVEDVSIMLKIIAGPDSMDQFSARVAPQDYPQQLKRNIRGLRVGVLSQSEM